MSNSRYFWAVAYPENMREDWKDIIEDLLQIGYCYIVHDKDSIEHHQFEDEEYYGQRKVHAHIMLAFNNTTTSKHAKSMINSLSLPNKICCSHVQQVYNVRSCYDYLIHATKNSEKKHHYDPSERIEGSLWDLGAYISVSQEEKDHCLARIRADIKDSIKSDRPLCNIGELTEYYSGLGLDESDLTFQCIKGYRSLIADWCKWVYFKREKKDQLKLHVIKETVKTQRRRIERLETQLYQLQETVMLHINNL